MATALWTKPLHLKQNSVITGDLDDDKITYSIKNAQIIHIQGFLGTDLYNMLNLLLYFGLYPTMFLQQPTIYLIKEY